MGEHESRMDVAIEIDEPIERLVIELDRVIAEIPELNIGDAEGIRRRLGLLLTLRLHALQSHAILPPELRRLATLAKGKTHNRHRGPSRRMQRDGAARAPGEIGGMGADDKACRS